MNNPTASDENVTREYSGLDAMVARNEEATASLFRPGTNAGPAAVAQETVRILGLPAGDKPSRSVVDFTDSGVDEVKAVTCNAAVDFVTRMGFGELLKLKH